MNLNLKPLPLLVLFVLLFTASNYVSGQSSKLIDDHFKLLNQHDVKAITVGYTDDAQIYSPNWEGVKVGIADITEVYKRYFTSSPDLNYKITNQINAGDNIVVEYTSSGTLSNPEAQTPSYMKG